MTPSREEYGLPIPGLYSGLSEAELVENPAAELFAELGWDTANLFHETFGAHGTEGRGSRREVFCLGGSGRH